MTPPLRRSRLRLMGAGTLTVLAAALSSSSALAQTGFTANRFDPSEKGSDWFENESLDYRGTVRPAFGVLADYAKDSVVVRNPDGSSSGSLISDQLYLHVGASLALWNRIRFGASLPLELGETGNSPTLSTGTLQSPSGAAVGDLRLGADFRLLGEYQSPFELAIGAQVYLPTGSTSHFTGDGETRVMPRLMIAGEYDVLAYALRFGYETRGHVGPFLNDQFGDELSMGAAVGLRFLDKKLLVGPEISAYTLASNAFQASSSPSEALLGAHYQIDDVKIGAAVGTSFNPGDAPGAPSFRMLLGLEWHPAIAEPPPPPDRDEDGIPDQFDACPGTPGPYDEREHLNGCPPDRDRDGVPDDVDACPDVPGVATDDPKTNGCPPPPADRDHDGIPDSVDACPDVPGIKTDDPKTNGCPPAPPPNPDRDGDGIPNDVDACPDVAGPANEDPKKNGCPLARVENGQIKITEQVKFANNSSQILKESDTVLNAVLDILTKHPEIEKLKVQGYTDNKGSAPYNKTLSKQRAGAVKNWLVLHKVEPARLESDGYGADDPIDDNTTELGRKNNRRVEFHIGEKAAPGTVPPPAAAPAKPPAAPKK